MDGQVPGERLTGRVHTSAQNSLPSLRVEPICFYFRAVDLREYYLQRDVRLNSAGPVLLLLP